MNAKLRKRSGIAFFVAEDFHVSHHILVYPEFLIRLTLPGRFHMHQNIIDIIYRAFNTFLHRPGNLMRLCNRYLRIHLYIERNYIPVSYHSRPDPVRITCSRHFLDSFEYLIIHIDILHAIHKLHIRVEKNTNGRLDDKEADYQSRYRIEYRQFEYKSKNQPNKTPAEMTTSLRIFIAFAVSMELSIFFPCLYWYEASISLPTIENIVT